MRSFLSWWIGELTAVLGPRLAGAGPRRDYTLVESGDGLACWQHTRRGTTSLGPVGLAGGGRLVRTLARSPVEYRLDPSRLTETTLTLAESGGQYLDQIIRHRLDQLTPLAPERVVYGYWSEPAPEPGRLAVHFAATSRDILDAAFGRLAAVGIRPVSVGSAAEPIERPVRADLLGEAAGRRAQTLRRRVGLALVAAVLAGLLASGYAFSIRSSAVADSELVEASLAARQKVVEAWLARMGAGTRDQELMALKRPGTSMLLLLEELSRRLPEGTYLTELSVEGSEVRITGYSSGAPALIGLLEGSPMLTEAAFAAPTTRTESGDRDYFQILARLRVTGEAAGGAEPSQ